VSNTTRKWILISCSVIAWLGVTVTIALGQGPPTSPLRGDVPGTRDSARAGSLSPAVKDFPDDELGRLLEAHMSLLAGHGRDAERNTRSR